MTFLHPILLGVGAACVAIPIVIHLLMRRRRKPVRWAAMRFLLEAHKQRQRRVRLEHFLLLASRCLLVALIALAVARPLFGGRDGATGGAREVFLLIDTSLASAAESGDGSTELAGSVGRAAALLETLDAARGDRAALITLGGPARAIVSPPTTDLALIERRLRDLSPTDSAMDLSGGLALITPDPESVSPPTVAVFSAFRAGSVGRASSLASLPGGVDLTAAPPLETELSNTGLASLTLLRPVVIAGGEGPASGSGQAVAAFVRSGTGADQAGSTTVRVLTDTEGARRELGRGVVRWAPGQTETEATIDLDLSGVGGSGRVVLRAEIDADANPRDDAAWAVLDVREQLRVAIVGSRRFGERPRIAEFGPSDWLELALKPLGPRASERGERLSVEVLDAARLAVGGLAGFDAVLIAEPGRVRAEGWTALGRFRERGGSVLCAVSRTPGAQLWTGAAAEAFGVDWEFGREPEEIDADARALAVPEVDGDDPLWLVRSELGPLAETVGVDRLLPVDAGETGTALLTTTGGRPVMLIAAESASTRRAGRFVLIATAIDLTWTDLPARPLMVPLVQETIRSGIGRNAAVSHATAGSRVSTPTSAVELIGTGSGAAIAVEPSSGLSREPVRVAGWYQALDASGVAVGTAAVQPDAAAGEVTPVARDRVGAWLSTATGGRELAWSDGASASGGDAADDARRPGPGPGLLLLAAALAVALVELGLARLVSHASTAGGGA